MIASSSVLAASSRWPEAIWQRATPTAASLARSLAVVGLDLSARAYPAGPALRDGKHVALLGRLDVRVARPLVLRGEVPMVYVSHHAPELKRIATSVVLLDAGRVAATGGIEVLDAATAELMG